MMDFTPIARHFLAKRAARTDRWAAEGEDIQRAQLAWLLSHGGNTAYGRAVGLDGCNGYEAFRERVPLVDYEPLRPYVMRMIRGERDVLWRGQCLRYAQSSGTSGGKSKYIPVTADSLRRNHYPGASDSVAHYLRATPGSRMFSGKGFILGGSFANELHEEDIARGVRIGDLSATLIDRIPAGAGMFRVPSKRIALMPDWEEKLPALANAALRCNITNISGVPSWFLTVIRTVLQMTGAERITDVWRNLEVFFHGGIAFSPYREEYARLCDPAQMHYVETYNASEGFFASATSPGDREMLLQIDSAVFYEFLPLGGDSPIPLWEVQQGKVYELIITAANGLWRYRIGDTVRIESTAPVKITIAGRTKSFINAFGEEVMEYNADDAIASAMRLTGARIANYTVAPVYARNGERGCHQWIIEWLTPPMDTAAFAAELDRRLQEVNSDYQAKRSHGIFLAPPQVVTVPAGTFDRWLETHGNGKLGGQRKIPRLSNDRRIAEQLGVTERQP